jgi:DHA2 family multidrug resistance protein
MVASMLVAIDTTIANVALPHMQGSFSSSQDQTAWVLTSYIVAAAVMTPLSGWLGTRVGFKRTFLISIAGFAAASLLCGLSTNLTEIVIFRFIQGICGASLQPLGQAVTLDLYPPNKIGQVMAISGSFTFIVPIAGPVLGGWLTENFSWRWVFLVNLPIGALAFAGVWLFMDRGPDTPRRPFDFLGFGALSIFIISLQLLLDRGPSLDWFSSGEIRIEALCAAIAFYVFIVQTLTSPHPFFDRALALDRNFVAANIFAFSTGMVMFSTLALQPPLLQGLMGYSVVGAGMVMAPRGVSSFISMMASGRLVERLDTRLLMFCGLGFVALSMHQMSRFDLSMDTSPIIGAGLIQGLGMGLVVVPMNVLCFATIAPSIRADGAVVYALVRNIGQSVGVSLTEATFANQLAVAHSDLAAHVQPSSPVLSAGLPAAMNLHTAAGLSNLNAEVTRQATMVSYVDVFHVGMLATLATLPLILILKPPRATTTVTELVAVE